MQEFLSYTAGGVSFQQNNKRLVCESADIKHPTDIPKEKTGTEWQHIVTFSSWTHISVEHLLIVAFDDNKRNSEPNSCS